jgi:hypothetical protein
MRSQRSPEGALRPTCIGVSVRVKQWHLHNGYAAKIAPWNIRSDAPVVEENAMDAVVLPAKNTFATSKTTVSVIPVTLN